MTYRVPTQVLKQPTLPQACALLAHMLSGQAEGVLVEAYVELIHEWTEDERAPLPNGNTWEY